MDQLVHWNQLLAHALSFLVFLFLVRGAFNAIIYPPMRERRERIKAEFDRIEAEKGEVAKLRKESQEMLVRARTEIGIERDKAQVALRNEVVNLAMEIAGKVVQEELTAEKHRKLVDAFLAEVEQ